MSICIEMVYCHIMSNKMSMQYIIAGLGNPEEKYKNTRHNTGRIFLEKFRIENNFPEWEENKKGKLLITENKIGKNKVILIEPDNFMNNSGKSISIFVTNGKKAKQLIVVYDDIDLPIGTFKLSFNRGSGGHKGIESISRAIKTKEFIRARVGISKTTPKGNVKKPKGEDNVHKFILGNFTPDEMKKIKSLSKEVNKTLKKIITDGYEKAVSCR